MKRAALLLAHTHTGNGLEPHSEITFQTNQHHNFPIKMFKKDYHTLEDGMGSGNQPDFIEYGKGGILQRIETKWRQSSPTCHIATYIIATLLIAVVLLMAIVIPRTILARFAYTLINYNS